MECGDEKWGEDEEVAMDVDLTEEEQIEFISQIHTTRKTLSPSHTLKENFGLQQVAPSAVDYSVRSQPSTASLCYYYRPLTMCVPLSPEHTVHCAGH